MGKSPGKSPELREEKKVTNDDEEEEEDEEELNEADMKIPMQTRHRNKDKVQKDDDSRPSNDNQND